MNHIVGGSDFAIGVCDDRKFIVQACVSLMS
jgi:hypothetical protein